MGLAEHLGHAQHRENGQQGVGLHHAPLRGLAGATVVDMAGYPFADGGVEVARPVTEEEEQLVAVVAATPADHQGRHGSLKPVAGVVEKRVGVVTAHG